MNIDWVKPCNCVGLATEHEFGSPGCSDGSDGHDRSKPRYRLFDLSEEKDGRPMVWHYIEADTIVGAEATDLEATMLFFVVDNAPWRDGFWRAFKRNKKATIYAPMLPV